MRVDLDAEAGYVRRLLDSIQRLIPRRQRLPGLRIDVRVPVRIPGRKYAVVDDAVTLRPPHLVVGRGQDPA